ncbi:ankyrin repeat domain-containing protein [Alkalicoccus daliensis]|uniref:Uncharacterized protein n=1 Tax=Alkalicoccus daliensis TaxID=745820 RepID=A0A1H0E615_9BACI|nr:ankyrin repeat domain-containing protein [Alkalicoccus daliensis]SDN77874.1 protein of unknown function [Alkalicoccus daliensis]
MFLYTFLKKEWIDLYSITIDIEDNLFKSPNISMIKLRQLEEVLIKKIANYENLKIDFKIIGFNKIIFMLVDKEILPHEFKDLLLEIRKKGNEAAHNNYSNMTEAQRIFNSLFRLISWFVATYGQREYLSDLDALPMKEKVILQEYLLKAKTKVNEKNKIIEENHKENFIDFSTKFYDPFYLKVEEAEKKKQKVKEIYERDVFETIVEYKNRIELMDPLPIGTAFIDFSKMFLSNEDKVVLFYAEVNKDYSFININFDIFYAYINDSSIKNFESEQRFTLLSKLSTDNKETLQINFNEMHITNNIKDVIQVFPINFTKPPFEQDLDFRNRVKKIPPIQIGLLELKKDLYDIENEIFPCTIRTFQFADSLDLNKNDWYIQIPRDQAKVLFENSVTYYVKATFQVMDNALKIKDMIIEHNKRYEVKQRGLPKDRTKHLTPLKSFDINDLIFAVQESDVEKVKNILSLPEADVNRTNKGGVSLLQMAAARGHDEIVDLLILNGANLNIQSKNKTTPLYAASINNHLRVIERLLDAGADPNIVSNSGKTAHNILSENRYKGYI